MRNGETMANCPKCNYKLKITDWRPECPNCGINVIYYGIEDRLKAEADQAEKEHALFQPKIDRVKSSFVGSTLAKIRIGLCFLPLLSTLLPMGKISYETGFLSKSATINIISIVKNISDNGFDFNLLTGLMGNEVVGKTFTAYTVALFSLVLALLCGFVGLILLFLTCSPHGIKRNVIIESLGFVFSAVSCVSSFIMMKDVTTVFNFVKGSINPLGFIAIMVSFIILITVNLIDKKRGVKIKYKDVSEFLLPYEERESTKAARAAEAAKKAEEAAVKAETVPQNG